MTHEETLTQIFANPEEQSVLVSWFQRLYNRYLNEERTVLNEKFSQEAGVMAKL